MTDTNTARASAPWRPDDIVAYEEMRDLAVHLQTRLIATARQHGAGADAARQEAATVRRAILAVDGFDRKAVDAHTRTLALRLTALPAEGREHG